MDKVADTVSLFVTVQLDRQLYALPAGNVVEALALPEFSRVAGQPTFVRGVAPFRDRVVPLVDLRARLGMVSAVTEVEAFCALMREREQDHRRWLQALLASIAERTAFTLVTDPHLCAFGRWYDTYRAEDPWTAVVLRRFETPHQRIHGLAAQVKELQVRGEHDAATALVKGAGARLLEEMVGLFARVQSSFREQRREVTVVLEAEGRRIGAIVDRAHSVERLSVEPAPAHARGRDLSVRALGRKRDGAVVPILEPGAILDHATAASLVA